MYIFSPPSGWVSKFLSRNAGVGHGQPIFQILRPSPPPPLHFGHFLNQIKLVCSHFRMKTFEVPSNYEKWMGFLRVIGCVMELWQ